MTAITIPETLGYRARKVRRAMIANGRTRGMTLVADQFDRNQLTVANWAPAFRDRFGGASLSDDDLALSLAGHPRHHLPGDEWPSADLARSYKVIASFASPEPDHIQAAREVIEGIDAPDELRHLAHQTIGEYEEATPAARRRWQNDDDLFYWFTTGEVPA